jgi:hypothetical protein
MLGWSVRSGSHGGGGHTRTAPSLSVGCLREVHDASQEPLSLAPPAGRTHRSEAVATVLPTAPATPVPGPRGYRAGATSPRQWHSRACACDMDASGTGRTERDSVKTTTVCKHKQNKQSPGESARGPRKTRVASTGDRPRCSASGTGRSARGSGPHPLAPGAAASSRPLFCSYTTRIATDMCVHALRILHQDRELHRHGCVAETGARPVGPPAGS